MVTKKKVSHANCQAYPYHIQEVIAGRREFGVFARFSSLSWLRSIGAAVVEGAARVDFPLEREDERYTS